MSGWVVAAFDINGTWLGEASRHWTYRRAAAACSVAVQAAPWPDGLRPLCRYRVRKPGVRGPIPAWSGDRAWEQAPLPARRRR